MQILAENTNVLPTHLIVWHHKNKLSYKIKINHIIEAVNSKKTRLHFLFQQELHLHRSFEGTKSKFASLGFAAEFLRGRSGKIPQTLITFL